MTQVDATILAAIIGGMAVILAAIITVLRRKERGEESRISTSPEALKRKHKYDVFVSAPLAAFSDPEELKADRQRVMKVVNYLKDEMHFTVHWPGADIESFESFDAPDIAAKKDAEAIISSKYFLMLYPDKMVSSVLFEAGIALHECITSIYFVKSREHLPYLMKFAPQAFQNVRIYEGNNNNLIALLKKHNKSFFNPKLEV